MDTEKKCTLYSGRSIFLFSQIDEIIASEFISRLIELQATNPLEDITIYINSPGGDVYSMFAMIDTMDMVACDIKTVVIGSAMSAAAWIALCGTPGKRYITKNSRLMLHSVSGTCFGAIQDINIEIDEIKNLHETAIEIIEKRSKLKKAEIKNILDRDKYIYPKEAIQMGLIDGILTKVK